ncbi:hypothetical protein ANO11243_056910 [Dothideomycetidae sp. 11243]|nr:hypothetical protein ANO11243_056910 [fungal sp. No.11243]
MWHTQLFALLSLACITSTAAHSRHEPLKLKKAGLECYNFNPAPYVCGAVGYLKKPRAAHRKIRKSVPSLAACLGACHATEHCVSFGFDKGSCTLYTETLMAQEVEVSPKTNTAFYNRHCFKCEPIKPSPTPQVVYVTEVNQNTIVEIQQNTIIDAKQNTVTEVKQNTKVIVSKETDYVTVVKPSVVRTDIYVTETEVATVTQPFDYAPTGMEWSWYDTSNYKNNWTVLYGWNPSDLAGKVSNGTKTVTTKTQEPYDDSGPTMNLYGDVIPTDNVTEMYFSHILCREAGSYVFASSTVDDRWALWIGSVAVYDWAHTPANYTWYKDEGGRGVITSVDCALNDTIPFRWIYSQFSGQMQFHPGINSPNNDYLWTSVTVMPHWFGFEFAAE